MKSHGVVMCVSLGLAGLHATAQVVPIGPGDLGPNARLETFENYGDDLKQGGFGDLMVPDQFTFDSGARFLNLGTEDFGSVVDWSVSPNTGWGLSLDGGDIGFGQTAIPSGVAFFGYSELGSLFGFGFDHGVSRVGTYFEAALFDDIYLGEVKMEAFDSGGHSLGFVTSQADGVLGDASLDSWIGLGTSDGSASISRVVFYGDVVVLDDMRFEAVPAPAGPALLAVAGCFHSRRRRTR
jgi:hypothetical protein